MPTRHQLLCIHCCTDRKLAGSVPRIIFHHVCFPVSGTLLHRIERCEHFDECEAARVVKDIATALAFLHDKGIAHRDLKPANILCETVDKVRTVLLARNFYYMARKH